MIFTAGLEDYARPIIDALDPDNKLFAHRIYREGCVKTEYYQVRHRSWRWETCSKLLWKVLIKGKSGQGTDLRLLFLVACSRVQCGNGRGATLHSMPPFFASTFQSLPIHCNTFPCSVSRTWRTLAVPSVAPCWCTTQI